MGSDLGSDVQAVCAVKAVARTDPAGAHSLSRERLSALFYLEGLAGTEQHQPLQSVSVVSLKTSSLMAFQNLDYGLITCIQSCGDISVTCRLIKTNILNVYEYTVQLLQY